jgi:hypothetical protein
MKLGEDIAFDKKIMNFKKKWKKILGIAIYIAKTNIILKMKSNWYT